MAKIQKLNIDLEFLKSMYQVDPKTLDEMALPSLFHKNPMVRWITKTRLKKALSLIEIKENTNLLDFGCGPGVLLLQLPPDQGKLIGVDILLWPAEKMSAHYQRNDIEFLHAANWANIIPDQSLDYIVATEVLEHIEDVKSILSDFKSKLKKGGKLIVSLPTENALYRLGRLIAGFSGDYHQEEIVDIKTVSRSENFILKKKFSIPGPGFFCLYKFYLFIK